MSIIRYMQPTARKSHMAEVVAWWILAIGPIVSFLGIRAWSEADVYNGYCGLLDAGWKCSKTEYVLDSLFNPFVAPILFAWAIGWLIFLRVLVLAIRLHRRRIESSR